MNGPKFTQIWVPLLAALPLAACLSSDRDFVDTYGPGTAAISAPEPRPVTAPAVSLPGAGELPDVGSDVAVLELTRGHEARLRALLEDVERRYAKGLATRTDVAQVEARLAAAMARSAAAKGALRRSQARYREVVGQPAPGAPY